MWVDFAQIEIEGRDASGAPVPVVAQDPRDEIHPGYMSARWFIGEKIEYLPVADDAKLAALCVEPSRLDAAATPRWLCVGVP